MNLRFWKKDEENNINDGFAPYEDINGKKTSYLGYFFLILMVLFGFYQGQNFLSAIEDTVNKPESNSRCLIELSGLTGLNYQVSQNYYNSFDFRSENPCSVLSSRESKAGLGIVYNEYEAINLKLSALNAEHSKLLSQQQKLKYQRQQNRDDYQTSLIEDVANTDGVLESEELGSELVSNDDQIAYLDKIIDQKSIEISAVNDEIQNLVLGNKDKFILVQDQYEREIKIYEFKKFALTFILIAPIFYWVWRRYSVAKLARSEYVIIWGGLVATFGLIFAQIIFVFIYEVLPHELIQAIFEFFAAFEFLWTLLYWAAFILVPLFFGWLIYLIQKKLYNKKAVLFRTLKNSQCPQCTLKINPQMNYCPICGYQLKESCKSCGHATLKDGGFCEVCGTNKVNNENK